MADAAVLTAQTLPPPGIDAATADIGLDDALSDGALLDLPSLEDSPDAEAEQTPAQDDALTALNARLAELEKQNQQLQQRDQDRQTTLDREKQQQQAQTQQAQYDQETQQVNSWLGNFETDLRDNHALPADKLNVAMTLMRSGAEYERNKAWLTEQRKTNIAHALADQHLGIPDNRRDFINTLLQYNSPQDMHNAATMLAQYVKGNAAVQQAGQELQQRAAAQQRRQQLVQQGVGRVEGAQTQAAAGAGVQLTRALLDRYGNGEQVSPAEERAINAYFARMGR